jgi:UDP-GlcNAc:undecaprenyl-phosphate/decaprenyl-phosphate GlcNAc-1-phosphate transferase
MDLILLGFSLAFAITFYSIPVIIAVANTKKLFDEPDERKVHITPIPSLGGVGIFAGFIISILFTVSNVAAPEIQYLMAAAMVIFFLGVKDDILILTPFKKFLGQVIAAIILIFKGHVLISSMHGFFGIHDMPVMASYGFTFLTIIVVTNSFNLIDGVDGLAGGLGLLICSIFGVFFFMNENIPYAILSFALCGAIIGFLIFNFPPAKIFMGDTGSLLIGLVCSVLVIKFIEQASNPLSSYPINGAPAVGFAILMVPLFDTLRVFSLRILKGRSPFSPDRNHIHHMLMDRGMSHLAITLSCIGANAGFILLAYFGQPLGSTWLSILVFGSGVVSLSLLYAIRPKRKMKVVKHAFDNNSDTKSIKILPISQEEATIQQN